MSCIEGREGCRVVNLLTHEPLTLKEKDEKKEKNQSMKGVWWQTKNENKERVEVLFNLYLLSHRFHFVTPTAEGKEVRPQQDDYCNG